MPYALPSKLVPCDTCAARDLVEYFDAVIRSGQYAGVWANQCTTCYTKHQCKLGTGLGQHYKYTAGQYRKVIE